MSVYLAISTLEDYDVADTIRWALSRANRQHQLTIGVAATVGEKFYKDVLKQFEPWTMIKIKRFDPATERGIGKGRNNALHAYNGQDYILQVDSHTHFISG